MMNANIEGVLYELKDKLSSLPNSRSIELLSASLLHWQIGLCMPFG